jgi:hypothetical protein
MVLPSVARYGPVGAGRPIQQQVMPPTAYQPQQPSTSQQPAKKKVKKLRVFVLLLEREDEEPIL